MQVGGEPAFAFWGLAGTAVLVMGGGESARARGGAWERVVANGEVVVSESTVTWEVQT